VLPETKTNEQANHPIYLIIFKIHQVGATGAVAAFSTINVALPLCSVHQWTFNFSTTRWSWRQSFL